MATYFENSHRMFLQVMMLKKICHDDEVRRLHRVCHERNNIQLEDLKVFVEKINAAISVNNMLIKKGKDEETGEEYYVLINTADNELSRLNAVYKPKEAELFKRIITAIVESDDGSVSSSDLLNLADEVKISKKEVDDMINKFSSDGWLLEKDGHVFFSTRAIVELQHFLKSNYEDHINHCFMCKNIVFKGISCISCDKKIHNHCKTDYFSQLNDCNLCPQCNNQFQ